MSKTSKLENVDSLEIIRYQEASFLEMEDQVGIESIISVPLGNGKLLEIPCTAVHLEELAMGIAFSQNPEEETVAGIVSTCVPFSYEKILTSYREFSTASPIFKATGSVHSGQLMDENYQVVFFTEDMGRHNVIDKIIGFGLMNKIDFGSHILMISSRMPLELVEKVARTGIRSIASISSPTREAVLYARRNKLNLVGMFRDNRFNIYSK